MKKIALLVAAALTLFNVAASAQTYVGKGKPRRRLLLKAEQAIRRSVIEPVLLSFGH